MRTLALLLSLVGLVWGLGARTCPVAGAQRGHAGGKDAHQAILEESQVFGQSGTAREE